MVIEISVAIIAFAFVCLVFYLFFVLQELKETLKKLNGFITTVEPHLDTLLKETSQLTYLSRNIVQGLEKKMDAFDPFLKSIHNFGEGIEHGTSYYKKKAELKHFYDRDPETWESERNVSKIADVLELIIAFWQTFKKRR